MTTIKDLIYDLQVETLKVASNTFTTQEQKEADYKSLLDECIYEIKRKDFRVII